MISFEIPGPPQGKGRPRVLSKGWVYTPVKTADYERMIQFYAYQAMKGKDILTGPVQVIMSLYMPIPGSWSKKKQLLAREYKLAPTVKPDIDNVIKVVFDAINNIVWKDDKQVVRLTVGKYYSKAPQIELAVIERDK